MWGAILQAFAAVVKSEDKSDAARAQWMGAGDGSGVSSGAGGIFNSLDHSGWTVATSGSKASATTGDRGGMMGGTAVPPQAFVDAANNGGVFPSAATLNPNTVLIAGAVVVAVAAVVILKKKKG